MDIIRRLGAKVLQSLESLQKHTVSAFYRSRNSSIIRPTVLHSCSICDSTIALLLSYPSFETPGCVLPSHVKYECVDCGHVSAYWFPETDKLGRFYEKCYPSNSGSPNFRIESEIELATRLINKLGNDINLLDFSCGDNYPILEEDLDATLYGCDVRTGYPYDKERLFRFDPHTTPKRKYQGIFSVDAIEHVSEIEPTWRYFNHALDKGGLMAHSFPTTDSFSRGHHFFRIPFHANLFSERSIDIWAKKMGFKYNGTEKLSASDVGNVHWFQKERTIE